MDQKAQVGETTAVAFLLVLLAALPFWLPWCLWRFRLAFLAVRVNPSSIARQEGSRKSPMPDTKDGKEQF